MNRNQKIRRALNVLTPVAKRAECLHDIGLALDAVEQRSAAERSFRVAVSKKGKAELRRYYAALRRLRDTYRKLDPAIKRWFSLEEAVYVAGKTTVIDREIAKVNAFLARPSSAARRDASRNKVAVAWAHLLLTLWRHKAAATRKGKWEQLAQILSGHPNVDLLDHLRAFKRRPTLVRVRTLARRGRKQGSK